MFTRSKVIDNILENTDNLDLEEVLDLLEEEQEKRKNNPINKLFRFIYDNNWVVYSIGAIIMIILGIIRKSPYMVLVYGLTCYIIRYIQENYILEYYKNKVKEYDIKQQINGEYCLYYGACSYGNILETKKKIDTGYKIIGQQLGDQDLYAIHLLEIKRCLHRNRYSINKIIKKKGLWTEESIGFEGDKHVKRDQMMIKTKKEYSQEELNLLQVVDVSLVDYIIEKGN